MNCLRYSQFRYLSIILVAWVLVFFLTRTVLLLPHFLQADIGFSNLLVIYGIGLTYDLVFLVYALLPLALYIFLVPNRLWRMPWHKRLLQILVIVSLFLMLFVAASEWFFWDEFSVRFNFISVDYLVYSDEVVNNILESYPVYPLIALLLLISVSVAYLLKPVVYRALNEKVISLRQSSIAFTSIVTVAAMTTLFVGQDFPRDNRGNSYQRELASNGPYQFFAAFRNNELDYQQFYQTLPAEEAGSLIRNEVTEPNSQFVGHDPEDIRRDVDNPGATRKMNVILVTIESLSAKYLGSFGNTNQLTPNLDDLAKHSLNFTNFYATGTRTTRGLEAITLSLPPTPGRSIVKRIGRESGYGSLGQQFQSKGYDTAFLYGGRGYFDNMNAFFKGNGYRIIDQNTVPEDDIRFANAWGMCDEDLYEQVIKVADLNNLRGQPFFLQLMTTSNHRPYTYPDGRIDIPSGDGREGAVKYTDFAIGKFLQTVKSKPWFDNTVFVFVADHTAGSAGKEDLPVENYHIPLFIYAPTLIKPRTVDYLSSQIDVAPTLLALLNFDYTSTFYGRNALNNSGRPGRALIGNYQHLGLFDGTNLAILSPQQQLRRHDDALGLSEEQSATANDALIRRDIAYYQSASHAFHDGLLSWHDSNLEQKADTVTHVVAVAARAKISEGKPN